MSKKRICLLLATVFFLTAACAALWPSARSVSAAAEGFTVVAGEVTQSENSYGTAFAGTGAFSLRSDRTAWADKFGVILRADAEDSEGLNVILSSEKDVWYTSAAHSVRILLEPIGEGSTAISLFADEALLGEYETVMFNWTADRSYSTNYLCLGKDGDQWIFNINDAVIETGADAALDEVLAGFPDKCGFFAAGKSGRTGHADLHRHPVRHPHRGDFLSLRGIFGGAGAVLAPMEHRHRRGAGGLAVRLRLRVHPDRHPERPAERL